MKSSFVESRVGTISSFSQSKRGEWRRLNPRLFEEPSCRDQALIRSQRKTFSTTGFPSPTFTCHSHLCISPSSTCVRDGTNWRCVFSPTENGELALLLRRVL